MQLRATTAVLAAAVLGLAACGQGEDAGPGATEPTGSPTGSPTATAPTATTTSPASPAETTTSAQGAIDADVALDQTCTNEEVGYTISYPAGWSVNEGGVIASCRAFDPGSIDLSESTEIPLSTAVVINRTSVPLDRLADAPGPYEVERSEDVTIAGQPAHTLRGTATGAGLVPEGTEIHRVAVSLGEGQGSLLLTTYSEGDADFEAKATIVDRMAETLELPSPEEGSTG